MADVTLAFDLVGNWTSSRILVRLLQVIDSPWHVDARGFVDRETGARAIIGMGQPVPALAELFAAGVCPVRPSIDDALFAELVGHKSVVSVMLDEGDVGPQSAYTLARATDALVNAGALAVRCRTSGLAHGADAFQALVGRAREVADQGDAELAQALYESYVLLLPERSPPHTVGMHALGAPDLQLDDEVDPDHATIRLEDLALQRLREGGIDGEPRPAPFTEDDPRHNPHGRLLVS